MSRPEKAAAVDLLRRTRKGGRGQEAVGAQYLGVPARRLWGPLPHRADGYYAVGFWGAGSIDSLVMPSSNWMSMPSGSLTYTLLMCPDAS